MEPPVIQQGVVIASIEKLLAEVRSQVSPVLHFHAIVSIAAASFWSNVRFLERSTRRGFASMLRNWTLKYLMATARAGSSD
jgi:hypothetical protein